MPGIALSQKKMLQCRHRECATSCIKLGSRKRLLCTHIQVQVQIQLHLLNIQRKTKCTNTNTVLASGVRHAMHKTGFKKKIAMHSHCQNTSPHTITPVLKIQHKTKYTNTVQTSEVCALCIKLCQGKNCKALTAVTLVGHLFKMHHTITL